MVHFLLHYGDEAFMLLIYMSCRCWSIRPPLQLRGTENKGSILERELEPTATTSQEGRSAQVHQSAHSQVLTRLDNTEHPCPDFFLRVTCKPHYEYQLEGKSGASSRGISSSLHRKMQVVVFEKLVVGVCQGQSVRPYG